jgi:ribosomal-protein-alanine N-acetyltransferase
MSSLPSPDAGKLVVLRELTDADLPVVAEIEAVSFPDAWSMQDFENFFSWSNNRGVVACVSGSPVGFMLYERLWRRVHIADIAVSPDFRGLGIGKLLIQSLIAQLPVLSRQRITLEVRKSNSQAIKLYEALGFRTFRTKPRYYQDGEDALLMAYRLPE